ncbi:MAG: carboxylesterase family protein [Acidimicrobiales bacterium]
MPELLVETRYGRLRGTLEDGLAVFRGVPYAEAPVGDRRFRAPQPPEPWVTVRDATRFGPRSPQPPASVLESIPGDPMEQSEDCLTLNIWTSAMEGEPRPVMVFVHGGGFLGGSSSVAVYHGAALARRGVVVVTLNYRLGVLGWLAHPDLHDAGAGGAAGNWGLLDQIAALRFVRDHAAAFGGDPGNVTIFGESAGAMCVAALLAVPEARRLFRRAIMQSGSAVALGMDAASSTAEALAVELGLGGVSRQSLAGQAVESLLAAQSAVVNRNGPSGLVFQPVVDGALLRRHPAAAIAGGSAAGIDLVVGTNRDEWAFFTFSAAASHEIDDDQLRRFVAAQIRLSGLSDAVPAAELIDVYRTARSERGDPVGPRDLHTAIGTDWVFRLPSMRLLELHARRGGPAYAYLFDWETPFGGGGLGACHALELPFVFGTADNPFVALFAGTGPEAEALSEAMQAAWVSFARTGDPGGGLGGRGAWKAYDTPRRATMRFGRVIELVDAPMEPERAYLGGRLGIYGEREAISFDRVRDSATGT